MLNWEENVFFFFFFLVLICSSLPNPSFGRVDLTGRTIGSTATYSCQRGYTLVGVTTRTCQANRQWSGKAPVCKSEWSKKDLWLLYQSTPAMSIHSGVCSFIKCSFYITLSIFVVVVVVVVFGTKSIATIRCCHAEKLISLLNNQLWTVAHLTTQKMAEW